MDFKNNFQLDNSAFSGVEFEPEQQLKSRYLQPPRVREVPESQLKYSYAKQLVAAIDLVPGFYGIALLNGTFIFGDFIEALIVERRLKVRELTISTLSLSQNNVDSLAGHLHRGEVDRLNLIISNYFYSHERQGLLPYIYEKLDIANDVFQLAVAGTHCKVCLLETQGGHKIVIHGSANLRSSDSLEQICIEENPTTYNFFMEVSRSILEKFATINHSQHLNNLKPLRNKLLWQTAEKTAAAAAPPAAS